MNKPSPFDTNHRRAFSLIEILTVISIISILATLVTPAFHSILQAGATNEAVNEISCTLEHARLTAMQTGTWVWVGIAVSDPASASDTQAIQVVEVASKDGSSDLSSDNLTQLDRTKRIENVKNYFEPDAHAAVLGGAPGGFALKYDVPSSNGRKVVDFSNRVIGFSPKGEAMLASGDIPEWIRVRVGSARNGADVLSVLISGLSGQVIVSR